MFSQRVFEPHHHGLGHILHFLMPTRRQLTLTPAELAETHARHRAALARLRVRHARRSGLRARGAYRDIWARANIDPEDRDKIGQGVPEIVGVMHTTWLEHRSGPKVAPTAGPKVRRNDGWPCGSGKQHKRCCGANA